MSEPLVEFFRAYPGARSPFRADKSALGTIPAAAYKYCAALTTASSYGWYVFSPLDFTVNWDGLDAIWTYEGCDEWHALNTTQLPDFPEYFNRHAPTRLHGRSPPFVSLSSHPGLLQIWSGFFVRTAPGWSLNIRPVVNYPTSRNYELFEGIVETDHWFGPLFVNLRINRPDYPVRFAKELPLFQVQAIPRVAYLDESHSRVKVHEDLRAFTETEWLAYENTIVKPSLDPHRAIAEYAVRTRKREKRNPV